VAVAVKNMYMATPICPHPGPPDLKSGWKLFVFFSAAYLNGGVPKTHKHGVQSLTHTFWDTHNSRTRTFWDTPRTTKWPLGHLIGAKSPQSVQGWGGVDFCPLQTLKRAFKIWLWGHFGGSVGSLLCPQDPFVAPAGRVEPWGPNLEP
jgi:hypothetical protein